MGNNATSKAEVSHRLGHTRTGGIALPSRRCSISQGAQGQDRLLIVVTRRSPVDCAISASCPMPWSWPGIPQEGGYALGDLLFGDANFSVAACDLPRRCRQAAAFDDYSMQGRTYKIYSDNYRLPLRYGLSYSL
jgi:beta-glucosidase